MRGDARGVGTGDARSSPTAEILNGCTTIPGKNKDSKDKWAEHYENELKSIRDLLAWVAATVEELNVENIRTATIVGHTNRDYWKYK